jgi:hypothetical protein
MRHSILFPAVTVLLLVVGPAFADDKSTCLAGVQKLKAAIAKKPPQAELDRLKQALSSAEQEVLEGDWDECADIIKKARPAKK